jgi:HK97 family phage portal protein
MIGAISRTLSRGVTEARGMATLTQLDEFMESLISGRPWNGGSVTTTTAMRNEAVWACVTVRSNSLAQIPLATFRETANGKEKAYDHYLYDLLRHRVNPFLTAFGWKRLSEMWICTEGNAYSWMNINGRGMVTEIWPWQPSRVTVKWEDLLGETIPFYYFQPDTGEAIRKPFFEMIHLRGPSLDGFTGMNPIRVHAQTIGFGLSVQQHGARVFENGAALRGILSPKNGAPPIDPTRLPAIKEAWAEYTGSKNAGKTAFMPNGLEYQPVAMSMVDAQYAEIAGLTVPQICRIFGVPPHKVFDLLRSTNNNIEHQDIEWRVDYQGPEIVNWEDELNSSLLSDRERQSIRVEFIVNAMMRATAAARSEYYSKALAGAPWETQDEVREHENLQRMGTKESSTFPITNNAPGPVNKTSAA